MTDIKVLLVEDIEMFRIGINVSLSKAKGIKLVAEADNGKTGVELAREFLPDIILMDIGLPIMDGIEATRQIKEAKLPSKVLIFTSRNSDNDVFDSFAAGADGYIMKDSTSEQLVAAITAVAEGTAWIDPQIARLVLSSIQRQKTVEVTNEPVKNTDNQYGLTERELEVLALIVEGCRNPEIAEKLVVTKATVKAHVHNILQKLYVETRTQATYLAMREGLV